MKMKQLVFIPVIAMMFISCDSKNEESSANNYSTVALDFLDISDEQTIQTGSGLNYRVSPETDSNIFVRVYDQDGGLEWEKVRLDFDATVCSYDDYDDGSRWRWISCTLMNSSTRDIVFTVDNQNQTPITFKIMAFQTSSSDGNKTDPVQLSTNTPAQSYVGDYTNSYYTFAKTGTGVVNISVAQSDSMTDLAENIKWQLTDSNGDPVITAGGTLSQLEYTNYFISGSGSCADVYSDFNVSCSTTIAAGIYNIEVLNVSDSPFTEYTITVNE